MKRIAALLIALVIAGSAVSCSEVADADDTGNAAGKETAADNSTSSEDEAINFADMDFIERIKHMGSAIEDNIPVNDYQGRTVIIYGALNMGTELDGETLNDAQYYQKMAIEERYNVKIEYVEPGWSDFDQYVSGINSYFLAGEYFADIIQNWNTATAGFIRSGYYKDLSGFDYIDLTKPWFFGDEMNTYTISGHTFIATGFMNTAAVFNAMNAVIFNKAVAENINTENLYNVVREGRWTLDYVDKLCADIYIDDNGDGMRDEDDIYALDHAVAGSWMNTFAILGIPQISINEEGKPVLTMYTQAEKCQSILDKLREIIQQPGSISTSDWNLDIFMKGNALMGVCNLSSLSALRDSNFEYGVLPPWKASENQKDYYTSYLPEPWCIPITCPDTDCASVILAAYAMEGYKKVLPECYESVIKVKYSSDEDSGEMIDLMLNNVRADGMFIYGDSSYIYNMMAYLKASNGYGSFWAAKQTYLENMLEESVTQITEAVEKQ